MPEPNAATTPEARSIVLNKADACISHPPSVIRLELHCALRRCSGLSLRVAPSAPAIVQKSVVDCFGNRQELVAAGAGRHGEPKPLIDPGECRSISGLPVTERGLAPLFRLDVDREPLAARILVHELGRRAFIGGQQPPPDQLIPEF